MSIYAENEINDMIGCYKIKLRIVNANVSESLLRETKMASWKCREK